MKSDFINSVDKINVLVSAQTWTEHPIKVVKSDFIDVDKTSTCSCLRWLPRVFTNNPSYQAYGTEGNQVTLSLRFCSRDLPLRLPI